MDETTRKDEYLVLCQLHIELYPRMNKEERETANINKLAARGLSEVAVWNYFIFLNTLAHHKGLIMKDRDVLPAVVRNTI